MTVFLVCNCMRTN